MMFRKALAALVALVSCRLRRHCVGPTEGQDADGGAVGQHLLRVAQALRRPRRQDVERAYQDRGAARRRHRPGLRDSRCGRQGHRRRRLCLDALLVRQASGSRHLLQPDGRLRRRPRSAEPRRLADGRRRQQAVRAVLRRNPEGQCAAAHDPADGPRPARLVQAADQGRRRLQDHEVPLASGHHGRDLQGDGRRGRRPAGRRDRARGAARHHRRGRMDRPGRRPQPRPAHRVEELLPAGPAPVDRHRRGALQQDLVEQADTRPAGDPGRGAWRP